MNLKFAVSITAFFLLFSCAQMKENVKETTFEVPYESHNKFIMLSNYFKTITFLPLETNKESIIGDITKLKIINNRIYILDKIGNSILVFNTNGKFEKKISSFGSGPDEYLKISDFDVENDDLYIMDISGKILYFKNDVYVNSVKIDFIATEFCITQGGFIFKILDFKKEYSQFIATSKDLKAKEEFLPASNLKKAKFNWAGSNNFATNNSKTYFSPNYSHLICELDNEKFAIKHLNILDFGSKNLPDNSTVNDYDIVSPNFDYIIRRNFFAHKNYIILDFLLNNTVYNDWIDTSKEIHDVGIPKNDINTVPFIPSWGGDSGLVGYMNAALIINETDLIMKNDILKNIKADDNPVLMIYTYKD